MSRRLPLLAAAVALSLLVPAACSGDDDGGDGDGSATASTLADEARLQALLLAPTDLPEVYSSGPAEAEGGGCSGEGATQEPHATAGVSYVAADDENTLYEVISEYDDDGAAAVIDAIQSNPRGCLQAAGAVDFEVEPLDFPEILDETVAVQAIAHPDDRTLTFHQVFLRQGDTLVIVLHGGFAPVDVADTEDLARRAAEKLNR